MNPANNRNKAMKKAEEARSQAMSVALKRKEEFLGVRVPKELRDKVIERAEREGIPVSLLIRKILEHAFQQNDTSLNSKNFAGNKHSKAEQTLADRFSFILGWEEVKLNKDIACSACEKRLTSGMIVTLGLPCKDGDHVVLCNTCKDDI